jgi:hypothetical protein
MMSESNGYGVTLVFQYVDQCLERCTMKAGKKAW